MSDWNISDFQLIQTYHNYRIWRNQRSDEWAYTFEYPTDTGVALALGRSIAHAKNHIDLAIGRE